MAEHTPDQVKGSDGRTTFWILHFKSESSHLEFSGKVFFQKLQVQRNYKCIPRSLLPYR